MSTPEPYWGVLQLQANRTKLALHCLELAGYAVYHPRIRERRVVRGRWPSVLCPLVPGYCFLHIHLQWHSARWAPGVVRLVLNGGAPARLSEPAIAAIRQRERNGLVELPRRPLQRGDKERVRRGPFEGHSASMTA